MRYLMCEVDIINCYVWNFDIGKKVKIFKSKPWTVFINLQHLSLASRDTVCWQAMVAVFSRDPLLSDVHLILIDGSSCKM